MLIHDRVVLAIDAGGTYFKSALVTTEGKLLVPSLYTKRVDSAGSAQSIREAYQGIVAWQLDKAAQLQASIIGIGVDTPGPFDFTLCLSRMQHKFQSIYGIPLKPWIQQAAGDVPIHFVHDSAAFIMGEAWQGAAKGFANAAGVMLGTGLGFACTKGHQVIANPHGGPGVILYSAPYRDGIAEDYVSRRGIIARYRQRVSDAPPTIDVKEIAAMALQGDGDANGIFTQTGSMLAEILYPILQQLQTQCLVIGGQIAKAYPLFEGALRAGLSGLVLEKIAPSPNPDDVHLLGCAKAFMQSVRCNQYDGSKGW